MKKKILLFILLFIPFMINAEEKCNIISGNGRDIGSEIECAGEHFYIVENKEDSVRMLAKYNLDIGYEYNRIIVSAERYAEFETICAGIGTKCTALLSEPEFTQYEGIDRVYENEDSTYSYIVFRKIVYSEVKQSPKAIGAHGDEKGNPEFPEYGIVEYSYLDEYSGFDGELYGNGNFQDHLISSIDFYVPDVYAPTLFDNYKNMLQSGNIVVDDISILSVKDLNDLVYRITSKELPLEQWGNSDNWIETKAPSGYRYFIVGSIKDYLPEEYNWLYSTTYWTRTYKYRTDGETKYYFDESDLFFMDTLGNLCNNSACEIALGAGIRPVVEISKNSINYSLTTKTDSNGVLETDKSHVVGDTIVLNATPKKGYKLEKLIVTTESGTVIEISGEDIIKNEDSTISINPNVFTMPLENVVVEAKWQIINPKTGVVSYTLGIILILMTSIGLYLVIDRKEAYTLE